MRKDLDFNGINQEAKPRELSEITGTDIPDQSLDKIAPDESDALEELTASIFTNLGKTYLKGQALKKGLSLMDPAQFIPVNEDAEKVAAACRRISAESTKDGTIIPYAIFTTCVDILSDAQWQVRRVYEDVNIPPDTESHSKYTVKQYNNKGGILNFIQQFFNGDGIAGAILTALAIAPFQLPGFAVMSVEQGSKAYFIAQVPPAIALFIELGIKAYRLKEFLKNSGKLTPEVEAMIDDLDSNPLARKEALGSAGIDYESFIDSSKTDDANIIIQYCNEYISANGMIGPKNYDHWTAYGCVSARQNLVRAAFDSATDYSKDFSQAFNRNVPNPDYGSGPVTAAYGVKPNTKINNVIASHFNELDQTTNDIYNDILNSFIYQVSDSDLCCVSAETKIQHKAGISNIIDLVGKETEIWNGEKWSKVIPFKAGTNKKLYRVTLSDGSYLDCTDDHKWLVLPPKASKFRQTETKDLIVGSKLETFNISQPIEGKYEEYAYEYGAFCGDGCCDGSSRWICICGDKIKLTQLGLRGKLSTPKIDPLYKDPVYRLHVNHILDKEKSKQLRDTNGFPSWVFSLDKECIGQFIAGYIETDGNVCRQQNSDSYRIFGSEGKMRSLQLLLRRIGVNFSSIYLAGEKGQVTNKGIRTYSLYCCHIPSFECHLIPTRYKLAKRISSRYKPNNAHKQSKSIDTARKQKVVSVVELPGLHDTYCFNENDRHMGVFNNVLTYQCLVEVFGSLDPEVLKLLATVLRLAATDLNAELARLQDAFFRQLNNLSAAAIYQIIEKLRSVEDKFAVKILKSLQDVLPRFEHCPSLKDISFAIAMSLDSLRAQINKLLMDVLFAIDRLGMPSTLSWRVPADRRFLLTISKILDTLALKLEAADVCARKDIDQKQYDVALIDAKDQAASEITHTLLTEGSPSSIQLTDLEIKKYFPDLKAAKSKNFSFSYGPKTITDSNYRDDAKQTGCERASSKEFLEGLKSDLLKSIEKNFKE